MKVELRSNGSVTISGYVNAVERDSRELPEGMNPHANGRFVERVRAGVFGRALSRGHPVEARFNHSRTIGTTADESLVLREDNIGLHASVTTRDSEVVNSARNGELRGWSFGFLVIEDTWEDAGGGVQRRTLEDIDMVEVSVLTMEPAYIGMSIEARGEKTTRTERRIMEGEETEIVKQADESARLCEIEILKLKGKRK